MKRPILVLIAACLISSGIATASPAPANFAGTWVLDKSKSQGMQGPMANAESITLIVTQDSKKLSTETKIMNGGQEMPRRSMTYDLDGNETTAEVGGRMPGKATLKAKWLADGKKLELSQKRIMNNQGNEVTVTSTETWELADNGKTLRVHRVSESPRGTQDATLVYTKQ